MRRRDFLKAAGFAATGFPLIGRADPCDDDDDHDHHAQRFTQVIDEAHLYMTHYAFFEEPDDDLPQALYFDAATGAPTSELSLASPIGSRVFTRHHDHWNAPSENSVLLPYVVEPPGFPPFPAPPPVVG